jgi:hypothetical protein
MNIHYFFTFWVIILVIFHKYTHRYFDLLYLTFITCVIGLYLSFIHPQEYNFILFDKNYSFKTLDKFIIVDLIFHILVFVYIFNIYNHKFKISVPFLNSLLIILLYAISVNLHKVYNIRIFEFLSVVIVTNLLYIIIFDL